MFFVFRQALVLVFARFRRKTIRKKPNFALQARFFCRSAPLNINFIQPRYIKQSNTRIPVSTQSSRYNTYRSTRIWLNAPKTFKIAIKSSLWHLYMPSNSPKIVFSPHMRAQKTPSRVHNICSQRMLTMYAHDVCSRCMITMYSTRKKTAFPPIQAA